MGVFWFSVFTLSFVRIARRTKWLSFGMCLLLSTLAFYFHFTHIRWINPPPFQARDEFLWLSAAAWICALSGLRSRPLIVYVIPALLLLTANPAALLGILTGIALSLPFPPEQNAAEDFGITLRQAR